MEKQKVMLQGKYAGHTIKQNGVVNLNFAFEYNVLDKTMLMCQALNCNTNIIVRVPKEKPIEVGSYMLNMLRVNHDGSSYIRFNSVTDHTQNLQILSTLVGEEIQIMCMIEIEGEESEDGVE